MERKNSNSTTERHNGPTEWQNGMAKQQQQNGNGLVETRH